MMVPQLLVAAQELESCNLYFILKIDILSTVRVDVSFLTMYKKQVRISMSRSKMFFIEQ